MNMSPVLYHPEHHVIPTHLTVNSQPTMPSSRRLVIQPQRILPSLFVSAQVLAARQLAIRLAVVLVAVRRLALRLLLDLQQRFAGRVADLAEDVAERADDVPEAFA